MTKRDSACVLVIGGGLSGAVTTLRLAQVGISVTCLEQGSWQNPDDYPGTSTSFELTAMDPWHPNPNLRRNRADYPIADDTSDTTPMLFNGVGGSTILVSAHRMRFLPSDFRVKSLDGVGADWPITYDDLARAPRRRTWMCKRRGRRMRRDIFG